jgi:hypothetical protein
MRRSSVKKDFPGSKFDVKENNVERDREGEGSKRRNFEEKS